MVTAFQAQEAHGKEMVLTFCIQKRYGKSMVIVFLMVWPYGEKVVTNLAVMTIENNSFKLLERAPGVTVEEIKAATEGNLIVEGDIPEMQF